jgi:hypothetical protein
MITELLNAKDGETYQFKEWKTSDNFNRHPIISPLFKGGADEVGGGLPSQSTK